MQAGRQLADSLSYSKRPLLIFNPVGELLSQNGKAWAVFRALYFSVIAAAGERAMDRLG